MTGDAASMAAMTSTEAIAALCLPCGICCDGTLFSDIKLQSDDDLEKLTELGLTLKRRGRATRCLQPCTAYQGSRCSIYSERPGSCRNFECRLLQKVEAGKIDTNSALEIIQATRAQADTVNDLLAQLGQGEAHLSLNQRYRSVMAEPLNLSGSQKIVRLRGKLMLAMHELVQMLEESFLKG